MCSSLAIRLEALHIHQNQHQEFLPLGKEKKCWTFPGASRKPQFWGPPPTLCWSGPDFSLQSGRPRSCTEFGFGGFGWLGTNPHFSVFTLQRQYPLGIWGSRALCWSCWLIFSQCFRHIIFPNRHGDHAEGLVRNVGVYSPHRPRGQALRVGRSFCWGVQSVRA